MGMINGKLFLRCDFSGSTKYYLSPHTQWDTTYIVCRKKTKFIKPIVINAYGCDNAVIDEVEYLGAPIKSMHKHTEIVDVNWKRGCGLGSGQVDLNVVDCKENSFETSTETTLEVNWGFSISHGISVDAKPLGVGVSTSVETSFSVGGSVAHSFGNAWASSSSRCKSRTGYRAIPEFPGAGVIAGYTDEF